MSTINMMIGIMGSGKSTQAEYLAKSTGAHVVSSDQVRADLYEGIPYEKQDQSKVFEVVNKIGRAHV